MKRLITTVLMLTVLSLGARAETFIGLFDNLEGTQCYGDTDVYTSKTVHVLAWLDPEIESVTAVEFSLLNLPEDGNGGIITQIWMTPLTIGYLGYRFSLAFSTPLPGPLVYMGSLVFYPLTDDWIGRDHQVIVREAQDSGTLAVVDQSFSTHNVAGGAYRFNCSLGNNCDCQEATATDEMSWSSIKALY